MRLRVARLLDRTGFLHLVLTVRQHLPSMWLTAIAYHRVTPPGASLFDHGVFDASSAELDWQLGFLRRYFTCVGVDEIVAWQQRGKRLGPNPVVITFDDAYRDNYTDVLPVLQKHGLRAVFSVPTRNVTERRVPWWDRIAYLINASRHTTLELTYPDRVVLDLGVHGASRASVVHRLHETVKVRSGLDLERFLDELATACDVPWDVAGDRRHADDLLMTWDQIRELRAAGMDIASHTRTHRILPTLSPRELHEELAGSRAELEAELGEPVCALSYPAGEGVAGRPALRAAVKACGYQLGFAGRGRVNTLSRRFDALDIHRSTVELDLSPSFFHGMLAIPAIEHPQRARRMT